MVLCVENPLEDKVTTNNVLRKIKQERLHFTNNTVSKSK